MKKWYYVYEEFLISNLNFIILGIGGRKMEFILILVILVYDLFNCWMRVF